MPHQHVSLTLQNHAYWHQVTFHVMMRPIWSKTNWEEHNLINTVMRNEHLLVNNCGIVIFMWPIISYYEVQPYCSEFKIEMHSNVFKSCYFYTFTVNHRTGLLLNVWNCWKSPPKTGLLTPHPHPPTPANTSENVSKVHFKHDMKSKQYMKTHLTFPPVPLHVLI